MRFGPTVTIREEEAMNRSILGALLGSALCVPMAVAQDASTQPEGGDALALESFSGRDLKSGLEGRGN